MKWRISPASTAKPDPNQKISDTDMNTWAAVQPGSAQKFEGGPWAAYRITFTPPAGVQKEGGQILFKQITGSAEIWLDGQLAAEKTDAHPGEVNVKLPPSAGPHTLTVLVNSGGAPKAGLSGAAVVKPAT